jgi:hypothetical protein
MMYYIYKIDGPIENWSKMTKRVFKDDFLIGSEFHKRLCRVMDMNANKHKNVKRKKYMSLYDRYLPKSKKRPRDEDVFDSISLESDHPGDKRLDTIFFFLNKLHRSPQQKIFHKFMIASFLRIIYGKDFDTEKHRVTAKYQFETRNQQVLICAPRRMGKTFATAFITIVMCIVISGIEVSIFSPGKRQSVALMGVIVRFIDNLGESSRIVQRNEEKLQIRSLDGKISKINAYPSAVRTLKGVSGTICVLEEMAQIDPDVLYEVIVPLHQIDVTSIIGISTITTEANFMTKYLKQKDSHGEPVFASKHIHLACEACREAEVAHKCNHNKHMLPGWSSERKRKKVNHIMKGQDEMLAREVGGVASSLHQRAFSGKLLKLFCNLEHSPISYKKTYDYVFHAIDPAAAGKASEIAITSMIRVNGMFIIIGMESFPCKTAKENHSLILEHVKAVRKDQRYSNAMSVFILENNMGLESDHISDMLGQNVSRHLVMNERDDGVHAGFRTSHQMKTIAVETVRERMMDNCIRTVDDDTMICVSRSPAKIREMLIDQLTEFREMIKASDVDQPKKFYSGKSVGKDDLVMSLLLNIHWSGFFYRAPKYQHLH